MLAAVRRFVRFRSFRWKLIATAVVCVFLPAFGSWAASRYWIRDAVTEQAIAGARESLHLVDGYVSNLFDNMTYIANFIQVDSFLNSVLKERALGGRYAGPDAEFRRFSDQLAVIRTLDNLSIIGEDYFVTVLLPNGESFANYGRDEYDPSDILRKPWMANLRTLSGFESYWVGAEPNPFAGTGEYMLTMARPLRFSNSNVYGYVVVSIPERQVHQIFNKLAAGREMMLLDAAGRIVSHERPDRIGEVPGYRLDREAAIVRSGGRDVLLTSYPVSAVKGWRLVSLTPYREAVRKINGIFNTVIAIQLSFFAAFLIVLVYGLRRFTMPLVRLSRLATLVELGNLNVRSGVRGPDEIGKLGASFDSMLDRIQEMIREITMEQARKRKAELAMLQAQIRPHFLFNVLNSIRMKVLRRGDRDSADMIASLSRLMRLSIERSEETIPLHEELAMVEDYVRLMNLRQREKASLAIGAEPEALWAEVPRFVLQPLVENAVIHGLGRSAGLIRVRASVREGELVLEVSDDGAGMEQERLELLRGRLAEICSGKEGVAPAREGGSGGSGIGLANVAERMRLRFGDGFSIRIDSAPGAGTRVEMRMPCRGGETADVQSDARR